MGKIILNGKEYAGSGGSGGHTIVDPTGTDMPQENKLQFTGAVNVSDDSVNGQTVVDIEGGGNYYLNTIYSEEEKKVGYWTDGKPLYQRTYDLGSEVSVSNSSWQSTGIDISNVEMIPKCGALSADGSYQSDLLAGKGGGTDLLIQTPRNSTGYVRYLILQYTKTTDTADPNPQVGNVIYLPTIYSEEERQVGVWRDGKPLYQKTISFGALPNSTSKSVAHGISDLDKIVDFSALAKRPEPFNIIPLPSSHYQSTSAQQEISFNATNITIRNGNNASAYTDVYVTLQYTKTTDVAGSGNWNTDGVPTHHYSTNEQVIGTWIDGKPLYECTVDGLSLAVNMNWSSEVATNLNIKYLVNATLYDNSSPNNSIVVNVEQVQVLNGGFRISHSTNSSGRTITRAVIQYTKTTD